MAIELLPFMRAPTPLKWLRSITAEEAAYVTSDLSFKIGKFLIDRLGYVYAQPSVEGGLASVSMQLSLPNFSSAEVSRADLITPDVDFDTRIMTPAAVHIYSGSGVIEQPSTMRFDFTHDQYRSLAEGKLMDMHLETSGIGIAGGVSCIVVTNPEAVGLMEYLESGRSVPRLDLG